MAFPHPCDVPDELQNTTLVLDATRIADGTQVMLKKLTTRDEPYEAFFGRLFSSEEHASHPSNHCVPIYDAFPIPEDEGIVLIAMPRLEDWWKSLYKFETVGEVVEFCRQIFEVRSISLFTQTSCQLKLVFTIEGSSIHAQS